LELARDPRQDRRRRRDIGWQGIAREAETRQVHGEPEPVMPASVGKASSAVRSVAVNSGRRGIRYA
jgi:hypothetical protein